jgi:CRP-like cAMP-binding protein
MPTADLHALVRSVLCKGLTADQAEQLVAATVPMYTPPDTIVLHEGEPSSGLLIFVHGMVDIIKRSATGASQTLATVKAPTVIGEIGLLTDRPRSASVKTRTACEFHLLTRTQFQRLVEMESVSAYKLIVSIAGVLARRLDSMDQKVIALSERPRDAEPADDLSRLREHVLTGGVVLDGVRDDAGLNAPAR